jgi:hypothetical protein
MRILPTIVVGKIVGFIPLTRPLQMDGLGDLLGLIGVVVNSARNAATEQSERHRQLRVARQGEYAAPRSKLVTGRTA